MGGKNKGQDNGCFQGKFGTGGSPNEDLGTGTAGGKGESGRKREDENGGWLKTVPYCLFKRGKGQSFTHCDPTESRDQKQLGLFEKKEKKNCLGGGGAEKKEVKWKTRTLTMGNTE